MKQAILIARRLKVDPRYTRRGEVQLGNFPISGFFVALIGYRLPVIRPRINRYCLLRLSAWPCWTGSGGC